MSGPAATASGHIYATLVDPGSGNAISPGGGSRYQSPGGDSFFIRTKKANVTAATTAGELIAAVADYTIVILGLILQSGGTATDVTLLSNAVAATPLIALDIRQQFTLPDSQNPWAVGVPSTSITITTGAGATTGVIVRYALVPNSALTGPDGNPIYAADGTVVTVS